MEDSIFAKIAKGEAPCHKIYENEHVLAFLNITPNAEGHTLVIPKVKPAQFVWDLEDDIYREIMQVCKKLALHLREASGKTYVHQGVVGVHVPYAHVHLIPFDDSSELYGESASDDETFKRVAERLKFED